MASSSTSPLTTSRPSRGRRDARLNRPPAATGPAAVLWPWPVWVAVSAATLGAAIAFVVGTGMHPGWDAYGWLTWGYQILHGRLNLDAAPSWKPLPFIFTLPYALFGTFTQKLWAVTAVAGTLALAVFAWRVVYRVSDGVRALGRWGTFAAAVGALFAAAGELGIQVVPHLAVIANSDPLNAALLLMALDAHFSRRPRLAYGMLFLASLGRPEFWIYLGLYGLWMAWKVPGTRVLVLAGWVLTIAAWLVPDAVWSRSVLQAGKLNLHYKTAVQGNKFVGVLRRWVALYEWPMQAAALLGMAIIVVRRDRRGWLLIVAALLWVAIEIGFAYHGFTAVPRYLLTSAVVMVVIAGVGVTRLLAGLPGMFANRRAARIATVAGPLVVVGILVAIAPFARVRMYRTRAALPDARMFARQFNQLARAIHQAGGPAAILRCGPVAGANQYQTQLAFLTRQNVSAILFDPDQQIAAHRRMVLFTAVGSTGWRVRAYNVPAPLSARCARTASVSN